MSELNDKELFEAAISDAPVETVETPAEPEVAVDAGGPVRDEKGRFAPKEPGEPEAPAQVEQLIAAKSDEAHVPSWRLREVNDAREAAERRAQQAEAERQAFQQQMAELQRQVQSFQKPQEQVDPWQDLPGHIQQTLSPYDRRLNAIESSTAFKMSRLTAMVEHGKENVLEMEKYIEQEQRSNNPQLRMLGVQMQNSDDPVGVAMQWYQRDKLLKETGGDLSSYKNKMLEDALKDPAFLAKAVEAVKAQTGQPGARPQTTVQLPPSINRATSAGSPHEESGDLSDRSLYAFATR